MAFSRRAASEMTKRVERIPRKVMGENAGVMTDALTWAGTYHGIGARLLRKYAEQIGLDPAFTIHDLEDSADLMNLVRHEKGFRRAFRPRRYPTALTRKNNASVTRGSRIRRAVQARLTDPANGASVPALDRLLGPP
jgi:superfamily I DNA/RNA helicase